MEQGDSDVVRLVLTGKRQWRIHGGVSQWWNAWFSLHGGALETLIGLIARARCATALFQPVHATPLHNIVGLFVYLGLGVPSNERTRRS